MIEKQIKYLRTAIGLLNSMVRGGESHSEQSEAVVKTALDILQNTRPSTERGEGESLGFLIRQAEREYFESVDQSVESVKSSLLYDTEAGELTIRIAKKAVGEFVTRLHKTLPVASPSPRTVFEERIEKAFIFHCKADDDDLYESGKRFGLSLALKLYRNPDLIYPPNFPTKTEEEHECD